MNAMHMYDEAIEQLLSYMKAGATVRHDGDNWVITSADDMELGRVSNCIAQEAFYRGVVRSDLTMTLSSHGEKTLPLRSHANTIMIVCNECGRYWEVDAGADEDDLILDESCFHCGATNWHFH